MNIVFIWVLTVGVSHKINKSEVRLQAESSVFGTEKECESTRKYVTDLISEREDTYVFDSSCSKHALNYKR